MDVLRVREIIEYGDVTTVPGTPPHVRGVINLRGSVVPVVDLAVKLGRPESPLSRRTCIVIVEIGLEGERAVIGVVADAVSQVIESRRDDIEPPPAFGTGVRLDYLVGIAKTGTAFVLLLDIDSCCRTRRTSAAHAGGRTVGAVAGAGRPVEIAGAEAPVKHRDRESDAPHDRHGARRRGVRALPRADLPRGGNRAHRHEEGAAGRPTARRLRELGLPSLRELLRASSANPPARTSASGCSTASAPTRPGSSATAGSSSSSTSACSRCSRRAADAGQPRRVSAWSAASSSGEEPFSLAMALLAGCRAGRWKSWPPICPPRCSRGHRPRSGRSRRPMTSRRHRKAFMLRGTGSQAGKMKAGPEIRDVVIVPPPQPERRHLSGARTVRLRLLPQRAHLLRPAAEERVLRRLLEHLPPGGYLFLGDAETVTGFKTSSERRPQRLRPRRAGAWRVETGDGHERDDAAERTGEHVHVLVVDDSAVVRQLMSSLLSRAPGITVDVAADPLVARTKMERHRPDVILLDLEMPRMDGLTFLKRIMATDPIPVVVCSGLAGAGPTARCARSRPAPSTLCRSRPRASRTPGRVGRRCSGQGARRGPRPPRAAHHHAPAAAAADAAAHRRRRAAAAVAPALGDDRQRRRHRHLDRRHRGAEGDPHAMPFDAPGIVIVQHMPAGFTARVRRAPEPALPDGSEGRRGRRPRAPGRALIARATATLRGRSGAQLRDSRQRRPARGPPSPQRRRAVPLGARRPPARTRSASS